MSFYISEELKRRSGDRYLTVTRRIGTVEKYLKNIGALPGYVGRREVEEHVGGGHCPKRNDMRLRSAYEHVFLAGPRPLRIVNRLFKVGFFEYFTGCPGVCKSNTQDVHDEPRERKQMDRRRSFR